MSGAERRRNRIFRTKHTDYHLNGTQCVAVRDRGSGLWLLSHAALRLHAIHVPALGAENDFEGCRIQFWGSKVDVVTSPVREVVRPERRDTAVYVSAAKSGAFESNAGTGDLQVSRVA